MKRILYTILAAAAILLGNYLFSNGTLEATVETPETAIPAALPSQAASLEDTCPLPTSDTELLRNDEEGYCLLYPSYSTSLSGYIVINPNTSTGGDMPGDAWVLINTETAGNRTAAQIAEEQIASVGTGFNITRTDVLVDGEQAIVVDGLPGQDSTRYVFVVHNDHLYKLAFMPWYPNATDPTPLENLYTTVIESFYFLPVNSSEAATTSVDISDMGTSFAYPFGLANGTQDTIVPQSSSDEIWKSPAHVQFILQGYPLQNTTYQPQISIYPADQYAQLGDRPKLIIERLQNILQTQSFSPQPVPDMFITTRPQEELPFLPIQGAGQVFHAQEKILSFQNGSGIRYVTQLSQAAFPLINNQDAFYTFQGITSDGKYYVSVIMPINLPYLAADYGADPNNPSDVQTPDTYPGYLSSMVDRLNQAEGEGVNPYTPSLQSLDALAQSLLVGLPATSDAMPSAPEQSVAGELDGLWITNIGRLNLKQDINGSGEFTATTDSYGDLGRQDVLQGTLNGDTATLNSQMLGDLTIVFSGDTFSTVKDSPVSFCGIRASESNELPDGCGFSGTWILAADSFFPQGSTVVLKQVNENVSGDVYDGKGNVFDTLTGQVTWGKGWSMLGTNEKGHTITLIMNPGETGFEYIYDDLYQLKLCAVRDGLNSADLGNFVCDL